MHGTIPPLDLQKYVDVINRRRRAARVAAPAGIVSVDPDRKARWYAVYTGIKCESRVVMGITALGFDAYCPMGRRRVHRKGAEDAFYPLFGRYVFVKFDPERDAFGAIEETDGVERLICNDNKPVPIPDGAIDGLLSAQKMGLFDERRVAARELLKPGQSARILSGPFAEFIGRVVRMHGKKRVEILLSLFGHATPVQIPLAEVRPA